MTTSPVCLHAVQIRGQSFGELVCWWLVIQPLPAMYVYMQYVHTCNTYVARAEPAQARGAGLRRSLTDPEE